MPVRADYTITVDTATAAGRQDDPRRADGHDRRRRVRDDDPDGRVLHRRSHGVGLQLLRDARPELPERCPAGPDHRDVLGRSVADLRHDGPDQLRPRRDGHVRRDDGVLCSTRRWAGRSTSPRRSRSSLGGIFGCCSTWCSSRRCAARGSDWCRSSSSPSACRSCCATSSCSSSADAPSPCRRSTGSWPRTSVRSASRPATWSPMFLSIVILLAVALVARSTRASARRRGRSATTPTSPRRRASTASRSSASCGSSAARWPRPAACSAASTQRRRQPETGSSLLFLMFAGITLGGLGSPYGALVGGFLVGLFVEMCTQFGVPNELKNVPPLVVLILILLVRPQGILGRREEWGSHAPVLDRLRARPRTDPPRLLRGRRDVLRDRGDRSQRAVRLRRTAQLRSGRVHGLRRVRSRDDRALLRHLDVVGHPDRDRVLRSCSA